MIDGIYHVTFSSNSHDVGQGIVVAKGDSINGGDHGYLYTGTTSVQGGQLISQLTIKQWNPAVQSVFGSNKEFVLELSGSDSSDKTFVAQGHIAGQPQAKITIRGRYLSAAA